MKKPASDMAHAAPQTRGAQRRCRTHRPVAHVSPSLSSGCPRFTPVLWALTWAPYPVSRFRGFKNTGDHERFQPPVTCCPFRLNFHHPSCPGAGPSFSPLSYDRVAPPSALFGGWVPAAPPALPMILSAGLPGAPGPIPTTISDVWAGGPCFPRHYSQGAPGSRPFFGR
jgi:hypothetical protein